MSSPVSICNKALSEIGARASIVNLDELSKEAKACKLHYDDVRRSLLRAAHWGFARTQRNLTLLGSAEAGTSQHPWLYMYAYPSDCLKMRYLLPQPTEGAIDSEVVLIGDTWQGVMVPGPSRANRFLIANNDGQKVILTNLRNAIGVYTGDISNVEQFDQGFEGALTMALAAKLTIPVTGNVGMKSNFEQLAFVAVQDARASDGNEAIATTDHTPDWIRARSDGVYAADPLRNIGYWYAPWDNVSWGE